jgi:predicted RNase H-like HicB family nuclease
MEKVREYTVLIEHDEDGWFVVEVPALPGCVSQGRTRPEALHNIHEAIELYIESLQANGEAIPGDVEVAKVAV